MATIEKRISNEGEISYRVKIRLRGHPQESASFKRITDAKQWAQNTESAIREGRYFKTAEAKRHTFAELVDRYVAEVIPRKAGTSKFGTNQKAQLYWWKEQLGAYLLSDIAHPRIIEARGKLQVQPATVNRYMAALSHVFTVAVREWGWMDDSPIRKIGKLKEPRGRTRFLTESECTSLLNETRQMEDKALYTVIVLALSTGARKGEILGLRWDDIDFKRQKLTFQQTKNGESRAVALVGKPHEVLSEWRHQRSNNSSLVFPSLNDTPVRIDRAFSELMVKMGIENFRFHDLRHTAASHFAMNGASLAEIAEILGHKTLQMVKRYAHMCDSHTSKVIERMNAKMFG